MFSSRKVKPSRSGVKASHLIKTDSPDLVNDSALSAVTPVFIVSEVARHRGVLPPLWRASTARAVLNRACLARP